VPIFKLVDAKLEGVPKTKIVEYYQGYNFYFSQFWSSVTKSRDILIQKRSVWMKDWNSEFRLKTGETLMFRATLKHIRSLIRKSVQHKKCRGNYSL
jgi:hypothetical protein